MTSLEIKNQKIDSFLHTLANQLANSSSVEESENILADAKMWMHINFELRESI